jgi:hypothetical protein
MGEHDDLLRRFQPALRYDSNEQFFADDATQFTDAPGIELRRAPSAGKPGAVLARSETDAKEPKLTLAFLDPVTYVTGEPVEKTDFISVRGKDYRKQYVRLRQSRPDLNNRLYGRAVEANGRLWLQYWAWYFYNDYQLALGFGTHEGDWESVQYRIGIDGDAPDVAVYAQHRNGEKRAWEDVERLPDAPDTPVVYVGRGSHAAYFEAGYHQTEAWYDVADGKRPAPKLELEIVDDDEHGWMRWPGRWGDTVPRDRSHDLDQSSPTGPGTKRHWRNPDVLLDNAKAPILRTAPRAPDVTITRGRGDHLQIDYDFSARTVAPRALVVTVNSRDEKGVPPMTHTYEEVATQPQGTIRTDVVLHPEHHYDVYASTVAGDPPQPSASQLTEIDPAGTAAKEEGVAPKLAHGLGRLFARIRGDD